MTELTITEYTIIGFLVFIILGLIKLYLDTEENKSEIRRLKITTSMNLERTCNIMKSLSKNEQKQSTENKVTHIVTLREGESIKIYNATDWGYSEDLLNFYDENDDVVAFVRENLVIHLKKVNFEEK
ncbi:hypothetical protein ABGF48_01380 [Helcococcus bovis]|uniref:hypothetical protein n=1 Tax=Helcococcus bovis TaxID=3153252 RepID=UPI0038BC14B3